MFLSVLKSKDLEHGRAHEYLNSTVPAFLFAGWGNDQIFLSSAKVGFLLKIVIEATVCWIVESLYF